LIMMTANLVVRAILRKVGE